MGNKTFKKLFVSSLTLVFAAATAISSTFAWFTTQTTAKVSQIDINVTSGEGFEIRFGGPGTTSVPYTDSDYKQTLSFDDFKKAYPHFFGTDGKFNFTLNHASLQATELSSGKPVGDKMVSMTDGELGPSYSTINNEDINNPEKEVGNYLEFDLYFRGRGDYYIYFNNLGGTYGWSYGQAMAAPEIFLGTKGYSAPVSVYDSENAGDITFKNRSIATLQSGNPMYAFAADAARMALKDTTPTVSEGAGSVITLEFPYNEPKIVKFTDGTNIPEVGASTGYGDALATASSGTNPITYTHRNYALEYYNSMKNKSYSVPENTTAEGYFLDKAELPSEFMHSVTEGDENPEDALVRLVDAYNPSTSDKKDNLNNQVFYGSLRVRIWLEGWDSDTFNAIFNDTLFINLAFESKVISTQTPSED